MRRVSDDTLSLSFTDVLTCVLGASIALFLIFVAIITLAGTQGDVQGDASGYSSAKLKSIQAKINQGYATSTVKIVSDNEKLIEELIAGYSASSDFKNISELNITDNNRSFWGVQLNFYGEWKGFEVRATQDALSGNPVTEVYGFVIVGGMSNCKKLSLSPRSLSDHGNAALFNIEPTVRLFIRSRYEDASC